MPLLGKQNLAFRINKPPAPKQELPYFQEPRSEEDNLRLAICKEALSWIPTPYHDHAGIKHVGCDCAFYPCRVYQSVGLIDKKLALPAYSPQQWLNSPSQIDKMHLRHEDKTYLNVVEGLFREIDLIEILPGDLMLTQVAASWTHGAIIIDWPKVIHSIVGKGVIKSDALREGFWATAPRRFFTIVRK